MIDLTAEQRALLESLARRRETSHSLVQRAQIVLRAADGEANTQIAAAVGLGEDAVGLWRRRWTQASAALAAFDPLDTPGSGVREHRTRYWLNPHITNEATFR